MPAAWNRVGCGMGLVLLGPAVGLGVAWGAGDALRSAGAALGLLHVHPNLGAMAFPDGLLHPCALDATSLGPALSQGDIPQQHHMGCVTCHPASYLPPCFSLGIKALYGTKLKAMGAVSRAVPSCPTSQTTSTYWGL